MTSVAVGLFAMSALNSDSAIWHPAATIAVVGLGVGWFQSAAYALMLGSVPADRYGTASGAMSLAQASGTVFCVAVVGAIFSALSDQYALSSAINPDQAFLLAYRDAFRIGGTTAVIGAGLVRRVRAPTEAGHLTPTPSRLKRRANLAVAVNLPLPELARVCMRISQTGTW